MTTVFVGKETAWTEALTPKNSADHKDHLPAIADVV
jgi:hypothetical protein